MEKMILDSSFMKKDKDIINCFNHIEKNYIDIALEKIKKNKSFIAPSRGRYKPRKIKWVKSKENISRCTNLTMQKEFIEKKRDKRICKGDTHNFNLEYELKKIDDFPFLYYMTEFLSKYFKGDIYATNQFRFYGSTGFMGVHTNAESKDVYRVYFVYADESNKSFFKIYNNKEKKIEKVNEKKGWNINYFKLGNFKNPSYHCLYSDCNRFSIGFSVGERK